MLRFLLRRLLWAVLTLVAVSIVAFIIITLPPGDFVTAYEADMAASGTSLDPAQAAEMRRRYGLDQPLPVQYVTWVGRMLTGDFGESFEWRMPVADLIWGRMGLTALVAALTLLFIWSIALPLGTLSAVRQYSWLDYTATTISFIGMATPNFLKALLVLYVGVAWFGTNLSGLFSEAYADAPWSWGRVVDLATYIWVPVLVLGVSGVASLTRVMRANLLDELHKPYVVTARAKGLSERVLIVRYPMRVALIPFASTVGWVLPSIISGDVVVANVLSLPTAGTLLLQSLKTQDMYLAGAFIMLMCVLVVIGTLLSDILLACLDPRLRVR